MLLSFLNHVLDFQPRTIAEPPPKMLARIRSCDHVSECHTLIYPREVSAGV